VSAPAQTVPHAPQLRMSVCRLTSHPFAPMPSQLSKPALHVAIAQLLDVHDDVAFARLHARPHAPQLEGSLVVSMHPLVQQVRPVEQAGPPLQPITTQRPAEHVAPVGQTTPHIPHEVLDPRLDSHPFANEPSQSPKPGAQTRPHIDPVHVAREFAPDGHVMPQPPQFVGSLEVLTHTSPQHEAPGEQPPPHGPVPRQKPPTHI
jgi:hypothetical protein